MTEWRSIDSAPRKKCEIILCVDGGTVTTGYWLDNSWTPWPWKGWTTNIGPIPEARVSHWQPLPPPPTEETTR